MNAPLRSLAALDCKRGARLLPPKTLAKHLSALPGWKHAHKLITRTFEFANYYETMAFVNALAYVAHRQDHHPDLVVQFNRVDVTFSTHDAGGVTLNDCICAAKIEVLGG